MNSPFELVAYYVSNGFSRVETNHAVATHATGGFSVALWFRKATVGIFKGFSANLNVSRMNLHAGLRLAGFDLVPEISG